MFFGSPQSRNGKYAIKSTLIFKCQFEALNSVFFKKWQKVSILEWVYFLPSFRKTNHFRARTCFLRVQSWEMLNIALNLLSGGLGSSGACQIATC